MLKPLIVITEKKIEQTDAGFLMDKFLENGFYPIWSTFLIPQISKLRDCTERILLIAPEKSSEDFRQICFYLRDICIDEEKMVFLCGAGEQLQIAKDTIPKLYVKGAYESTPREMDYVVHQIKAAIASDMEKKGILLVDDDPGYDREFRLAVADKFDVAVSDGTTMTAAPFLSDADIMILSIDLKLDTLQMLRLNSLLARRLSDPGFRVLYLAKDASRKKEAEEFLSEKAFCFSKASDVRKSADYIMRKYGGNV